MAAAISRGESDDAAVVGDAAPDRGLLIAIAQEGQFSIVDTRGCAQTQHITFERNPLQRQMFAHIAKDQITDAVCNGEVGHDKALS